MDVDICVTCVVVKKHTGNLHRRNTNPKLFGAIFRTAPGWKIQDWRASRGSQLGDVHVKRSLLLQLHCGGEGEEEPPMCSGVPEQVRRGFFGVMLSHRTDFTGNKEQDLLRRSDTCPGCDGVKSPSSTCVVLLDILPPQHPLVFLLGKSCGAESLVSFSQLLYERENLP